MFRPSAILQPFTGRSTTRGSLLFLRFAMLPPPEPFRRIALPPVMTEGEYEKLLNEIDKI